MDASEIYSKRLNAKEVIFPQKGEFTFPIAIKTPGGDKPPRGASTPRTSPTPSQVMSPTTRRGLQRARRLPGFVRLRYSVIGTHREYADYRSLEGVFVSQSSVSVASDRTGKSVGKSNFDPFLFGVRNTYSAHNQFLAITQGEKMVDRTRKPVGESSSSAQIRTLLDEQRQMIIAKYCDRNWSSRTPSSSSRTRTQNSTRRSIATATGFS